MPCIQKHFREMVYQIKCLSAYVFIGTKNSDYHTLGEKAKEMLSVLDRAPKQKLRFQYEEGKRKNKPEEKTKTLQNF